VVATLLLSIFGMPTRTLSQRIALVFVGGGCGSVGRYLVALWAARSFGATFPWGTLMVNVAGCFIIGVIATLADEGGTLGPDTRVFLVVGVLGGFTTFSSFSLETWRLLEASELVRAALYVLGSLALSFVGVVLGVALARSVNR